MIKWAINMLRRTEPPADTGVYMYIPSTGSGVRVPADAAFKWTASWACIRVICDTIAGLSWHVYRKTAGGDRQKQDKHPLQYRLNVQPNTEMTPFTFRETLIADALVWGDGYAEIERDNGGRPLNLWPIEPHRIEIKRDDQNRIVYEIRNQGKPATYLRPKNMFHLKGFGPTGMQGYYILALFPEAFALGLGSERYSSQFFDGSAIPAGLLKHPGRMDKEKAEKLIAEFEKRHLRKRRVGLLQAGLEWQTVSATNEDSQLTETRRFQVLEACRIFRVPPHKVAELERAILNNVSQLETAFGRDTIAPWCSRIQQEAALKLLNPRELVAGYYNKLNIESIMRGDAKARAEYYTIMLQNGAMSINQVRALEDMNGIGKTGDKHFMPLNFGTVETVAKGPPKPPATPEPSETPPPTPKTTISGDVAAFLPAFQDQMGRFVGHEIKNVREAHKRYLTSPAPGKAQQFSVWLGEFYGKQSKAMAQRLQPLCKSFHDVFENRIFFVDMDQIVASWCAQEAARASEMIETAANLPLLIQSWEATRAATMAQSLMDYLAPKDVSRPLLELVERETMALGLST